MHDGSRSVTIQHLLDMFAVSQIGLDERCGGGHGGPMALREVVKHGDIVPGVDQPMGDGAADVSSPTGYKYMHSEVWNV